MILLRHLRERFRDDFLEREFLSFRFAASSARGSWSSSKPRDFGLGQPSICVGSAGAAQAGDRRRGQSGRRRRKIFLTIVGWRVRFLNAVAQRSTPPTDGCQRAVNGPSRSARRSFNRICTGPEHAENRHLPIQRAAVASWAYSSAGARRDAAGSTTERELSENRSHFSVYPPYTQMHLVWRFLLTRDRQNGHEIGRNFAVFGSNGIAALRLPWSPEPGVVSSNLAAPTLKSSAFVTRRGA